MWSVYIQIFAALTIGIFLGDKISVGDTLIFVLALFIAAPLKKLVFKKFFSHSVCILLVAAFGIIGYHWAVSETNRPFYPLEEKYITAFGKIVDLPREDNESYIYTVQIKSAEYMGKTYTPGEKIRVTAGKKFNFGDCIEVKGFLKCFPEKLNNGDYDVARHYKSKGIYFKMYADNAILSQKKIRIYTPAYFAAWLKSKISDRIYENYSGDEAAVLKAVFTGYKDSFSPEFEDMLYKTNTMRLFYPAYMHLALLFSLIGFLGAFVKKSIRDKIFILLLIIYSIYNINTHYILKTALLAICLTYTKMKIGYAHYMESLCAICTVIILSNPLVCYESSFVLSVTAGILIFYFVPPIAERIKIKTTARNKRLIAVWLVMSVGMAPLNAYYFSVTNPYAFLINMLLIPTLNVLWIAVSVNLCILSVLNIDIITKMTVGLIYFIIKLPDILCGLPFFTIMLPRPSVVVIIIYYLCIYIVYRKCIRKTRDDFAAKTAAAVAIGLAVSCISGFVSEIDDMSINIVNVGQGDGAVISVPFAEKVLIDGGGSSEYSDYDYGKSIFVPFLKRNGYTNITAAVVTHYHSDHVKGIIAAMDELNVADVIIPNCMEENKYRREIEEKAAKKNIKLSYYKTGDILRFSSGMCMKIIAPDNTDLQSENENDRAYGVKVVYGKFSALFMGDISKETELRHLGEWGDCDVLKVGHHGSKTSTGEEFIKEVKPETAIISVGKNNPYSHPNIEVLKILENSHADIFRTDKNGNIKVVADKNGKYRIMSYY